MKHEQPGPTRTLPGPRVLSGATGNALKPSSKRTAWRRRCLKNEIVGTSSIRVGKKDESHLSDSMISGYPKIRLVVWEMNFTCPYLGNHHPNWISYSTYEKSHWWQAGCTTRLIPTLRAGPGCSRGFRTQVFAAGAHSAGHRAQWGVQVAYW